jgi:hypothetical protein
VGTAALRLDLLPPAVQPSVRRALRDYLDARLAGYAALPDLEAASQHFARAGVLQGELWHQAVAASRGEDGQAVRLLLPALNDVFDAGTSRTVAAGTHAPSIIFGMLAVLALVCCFLAGASTAKTNVLGAVRTVAFPLIFVVTVYVILDLEYPRAGLIRLDRVDQVLLDVRKALDGP